MKWNSLSELEKQHVKQLILTQFSPYVSNVNDIDISVCLLNYQNDELLIQIPPSSIRHGVEKNTLKQIFENIHIGSHVYFEEKGIFVIFSLETKEEIDEAIEEIEIEIEKWKKQVEKLQKEIDYSLTEMNELNKHKEDLIDSMNQCIFPLDFSAPVCK